MTAKKFFLYLLIASVSASGIVGIAVIVIGNFGELEGKILATTLTISLASILGLGCGAAYDTGRAKIIPIAGGICIIGGSIVWIAMIWQWWDDYDSFRLAFSVTSLGFACALLSLLSLADLPEKLSWLRGAQHAAVWLLTALVQYIIWFEPPEDDRFLFKSMGVLAIIVAGLAITAPILHKLNQRELAVGQIDNEIGRLHERIAQLEAERAAIIQEDSEDQGS